MRIPSFHSPGMFSSSQICSKRLCRMLRMLTAVSLSALMASAGISSGLSAFLFLSALIALLIAVLDGLLQSIGRSASSGCMSEGLSCVGLFNYSSSNCFTHLSNFSSDVVREFPFFVLHCLLCLLELVRELLGNQMQFSKVSLSRCFLNLFGQIVILSFIVPNAFLNFSICGL